MRLPEGVAYKAVEPKAQVKQDVASGLFENSGGPALGRVPEVLAICSETIDIVIKDYIRRHSIPNRPNPVNGRTL